MRARALSPFAMAAAFLSVSAASCQRDDKPAQAAAQAPAMPAARGPESTGAARPAVHAGSWYPSGPAELRATLDAKLKAAAPRPEASAPTPVVALIGPHAGLRFSGDVAASAYATLRGQEVRRVFLLGPSHRFGYSGIALPAAGMSAFATPLGDLTLDTATLTVLRQKPGFDGPPSAHDEEHSLEMHAIFIAAVAPRAMLVPLLVGRLRGPEDAARLADAIRPYLRAGDVVIASSDFTHYGPSYGYTPFSDLIPERLAALADEATQALLARDGVAFADHVARTGDTICGRDGILVLLALLAPATTAARVGFDTSGRMLGDWQSSVSYVSVAYRRAGGWPEGAAAAATTVAFEDAAAASKGEAGKDAATSLVLDAAAQQLALKMVRQTLATVLAGGAAPDVKALAVPADGVWQQPYGVFVTLKKHGDLRGCIGHIVAVQELWKDIRDNAIAAAVHDPRFDPVSASELASLKVEVSILTPLTPVSGPDGFVVGRHGVVLSLGGRRAVFLPQVAPEQGWDRETTLRHLANKAGLDAEAWRDPAARFEVFEAQVFGEE